MDEQKICQNCYQKHDCKEAYRQMGENEGPSVVVKVVFAFLLPIVIFIASLAVFEGILAGAINSEHIRTVLCLLIALIVTIIFVFIIKIINRQSSQAG
jgi:uncharacterized membrane protein (DUF485 family)